jgi:hypothetical protein
MRHRDEKTDVPIVLVKWYDWLKWLLERVDSFPKNQRFIFRQRMADYGIVALGRQRGHSTLSLAFGDGRMAESSPASSTKSRKAA